MAWQLLGCDPHGILTEAAADEHNRRLNERFTTVCSQDAVLAMEPQYFHWVQVTEGRWAGLRALAAGSNRLKFTRAARLALTAAAYCWEPDEPPQVDTGSPEFTAFLRDAERAQDESFAQRRRLYGGGIDWSRPHCFEC